MNQLDQQRLSLKDQLIRVGCWGGVIGALLYLMILFLNLSDTVVQTVAIFLGPIQILNGIGVYYFTKRYRESIYGRFGVLFMTIGATIFTTMVVTQFAIGAFVQDFRVDNPGLGDELRASAGLGNIIQLGLDIVFDIFISLGTAFLGIALTFVSRFPRWLGWLGFLIAVSGLSLNLLTFPYPPAESGYFDPGPFYGLFILVASIIILIKVAKPGLHDLKLAK